MGVALPEEARQDMGMAGDWKVVTKKVVGEVDEKGQFAEKQLNKGVHKRKIDEAEEDRIAAEGLITKKKGWGHTYKTFPGSKGTDNDDDLEALFGAKKTPEIKAEETIKTEEQVKDEEDAKPLSDIPTADEAAADVIGAPVKQEDDAPAPAVVFKKRKKIKV